MKFKTLKLAITVSWLALFGACYPATGWAQSLGVESKTIINGFHDALLAVMQKSENLGYKGRYERLAPHVARAFHLRLMVQIASGRHWRKAKEANKRALVAAFSKVSIGTYAARFDGFSGQSFKTLEVKPGTQNTHLVVTRLINPDGKGVNLTYVTKEIGGNWRIIDVILASGISELAMRRSEYRRVLEQGGIDGLTTLLNKKARMLASSRYQRPG